MREPVSLPVHAPRTTALLSVSTGGFPCASAGWLFTSRQRLALQEEWLLPVAGLSSRAGWGDDAGQLFLRCAQRIRPDFARQGQEEAIAAICQQVEGMPLALELAASWVRVMPCAAIARQIAGDLDFLTSGLRNLPARHRSLRAIFD